MTEENMDKSVLSDQHLHQIDVADESFSSPMNAKAQARLIELLLRQNTALEKELERINRQLDENTMGINKKGYMYKFREREIYFAPKWGMRYFVLQGNQLSYYGDDQERRPRRTISLAKCSVKEEGTKKNGQFHVFSIYLEGADDNTDGSMLMRLSSDNAADAAMWMDILYRACHFREPDPDGEEVTPVEIQAIKQPSLLNFVDLPEDDSPLKIQVLDDRISQDTGKEEEWDQTPVDLDTPDLVLPNIMLQRVKSASLVLQKSMSRANYQSNLKLDSTISGTKLSVMDINPKRKREKKTFKPFPGYKPVHIQASPSPLSNETRPGEYNFRGFFNLGVIILVITHADLVVNNMHKYGFKFTILSFILPPEQVIPAGDKAFETPALLLHIVKALLSWVVSILLNFSLEYYLAYVNTTVSEKVVLAFNGLISLFNIAMPCYWVWTSKLHPGANMVYMFQSLIMWMKLVSYAHANKDLRLAYKRPKPLEREVSGYSSSDELNSLPSKVKDGKLTALAEVKDVQTPFLFYPHNVSFSNLLYFLIAPTLCYQLNYPRNESIRWKKVLFLVIRLVFVGIAILFSVEQYVKPTLEGIVVSMDRRDIGDILERLLKLSIPNTYIWLFGFYWYFHLWLNLLGELMRFGDRAFYKDWWNAKTIDRYWRTWNMPVHHWVTRHLYHPLLRAKCSKLVATLVVFLFSALMHEIAISLPFQHISMHAFFGMLAQAPLIYLAKYLDRTFDNAFLGNALFWCTFCIVGQPMGVIMYYYDLTKLAMGGSGGPGGSMDCVNMTSVDGVCQAQ